MGKMIKKVFGTRDMSPKVESHKCPKCGAPHASAVALGQHLRNVHGQRGTL